eukprot:jgi/Phyca11/116013/e_gw1.29.454.1
MHGYFASLLRIRSALELLEVKFIVSTDFPATLRVFADDICGTLLKAEEVMHPLSYASLKLQRDENTMADIKRWLQCEQPLMLLALFLHHAHRQAAKRLLGKTPLTSAGSLCRVWVYYFKLFGIGSDTSRLYEDLHNWIVDDDVTTLSFTDFSSIHAYWNCMRSEMPKSKLWILRSLSCLSLLMRALFQ